MGIASMVIGIIAVIIGFIPLCGMWAVIPALVGLGLGIADLIVKSRQGLPKGMAIAGIILNPLAIIVIIAWYFLFVYGATQAMDEASWQFQQQMQQQMQQGMQPGNVPTFPIQPPPGQPGQPDPQGQPMQPMQPMQPVQPAPQPAPFQPPPQPQPVPVQPQPVPVQPPPGQ